jgi:Skp family chaperone for outer membrane proteins
MKRVSLLAMSLVFAAVFAGIATAQPGSAAAPAKIGWIDSGAFGDEKAGISKYVQAQKSIDTEMQPKVTELKNIQTQMQTLQSDIQKLQGTPASVPAENVQKQIADKTDQGQKLQRDYEYKQKDAQAYYARRAAEVLNPVSQQIMVAMREYAKQKGYSVILDLSALAGDGQTPGALLFFDPTADLTKDFITFFNARPATAATAATKP